MDYQNDLLIDKHKLDEEWIRQPSKMMRYSEELAQAIFNRNRAKENLDVIEASLDADARKEPVPAGLAKATETAIKSWIKLQDTYREALEAYHDCDLEVNLIQGAVYAVNACKSALENLVKLYLNGYWSEPRLDESAQSLRERGETRIRDDLNAALNKEMYAVGPSEAGFTAGPFPSYREASNLPGDEGEHIFRLMPDGVAEKIRSWDGREWVPAGHARPLAPAPQRIPIKRKSQ